MNLRLKMWIQLTLTAIVSIYLLIDCAHCMLGDDDSDDSEETILLRNFYYPPTSSNFNEYWNVGGPSQEQPGTEFQESMFEDEGVPAELLDTSEPVETMRAEGPTEGGIQMLSMEQLAEEQEMSNKRFLEMLEKYKPQRDLDPNDIDTVRDPDWPSCDQKLIMDLATAGDLLYLFDDDKQDDARQLLDNTVQPYLTHCIKLVSKDIEDNFYNDKSYLKEKSAEWIELAYSYARENKLNEVLLTDFEQYSRLMDPEQSKQLDKRLKATLQDNTELNFANKLTAYQTGREGVCRYTEPGDLGKEYEIANSILVLIITKFPDVPIVKQIILEHQDEFLEKSIHFWVLCRNLRKKKLQTLLP